MEVKSVLLIDDEDDIREIGEFALREIGGLQVTVASSGPEGLASATHKRPDVILLDVMMPGVDGPATLVQLRAQPVTADVPVIFLTAKVQRTDRERLLALGARAVFAKPFNPITLADEVRTICASR